MYFESNFTLVLRRGEKGGGEKGDTSTTGILSKCSLLADFESCVTVVMLLCAALCYVPFTEMKVTQV